MQTAVATIIQLTEQKERTLEDLEETRVMYASVTNEFQATISSLKEQLEKEENRYILVFLLLRAQGHIHYIPIRFLVQTLTTCLFGIATMSNGSMQIQQLNDFFKKWGERYTQGQCKNITVVVDPHKLLYIVSKYLKIGPYTIAVYIL